MSPYRVCIPPEDLVHVVAPLRVSKLDRARGVVLSAMLATAAMAGGGAIGARARLGPGAPAPPARSSRVDVRAVRGRSPEVDARCRASSDCGIVRELGVIVREPVVREPEMASGTLRKDD